MSRFNLFLFVLTLGISQLAHSEASLNLTQTLTQNKAVDRWGIPSKQTSTSKIKLTHEDETDHFRWHLKMWATQAPGATQVKLLPEEAVWFQDFENSQLLLGFLNLDTSYGFSFSPSNWFKPTLLLDEEVQSPIGLHYETYQDQTWQFTCQNDINYDQYQLKSPQLCTLGVNYFSQQWDAQLLLGEQDGHGRTAIAWRYLLGEAWKFYVEAAYLTQTKAWRLQNQLWSSQSVDLWQTLFGALYVTPFELEVQVELFQDQTGLTKSDWDNGVDNLANTPQMTQLLKENRLYQNYAFIRLHWPWEDWDFSLWQLKPIKASQTLTQLEISYTQDDWTAIFKAHEYAGSEKTQFALIPQHNVYAIEVNYVF